MRRQEGTEALQVGWGCGGTRRVANPHYLPGSQEVIQDFQASVLQVSDSPYDEQ